MSYYKIILFVLTILVAKSTFIESRKLGLCSHKSTDSSSDTWFHIGQLYSFCMQYGTVPFDENCSTDRCQECMKACPNGTFELETCTSRCNSSASCIDGCAFYNQVALSVSASSRKEMWSGTTGYIMLVLLLFRFVSIAL